MKQRFSSLDVKVIAHELSAALVSLRLSNIYDLSSRILLLKFAKPGVKKQLIIDSGFRCHLTDFARTTAASPSVFVQKLRKALNTRRVTAISQIGTDRIIEFQFSDGQYRLYLEFFAGGNVILTNNELEISTLLRHVPEGDGQEPQRPGLTYSLQNRQNYGGVPPLTKNRVRDALQTIVQRATTASAGKIKKKPGDVLRKGLATTITELPPILVDHAMKVTGFDPTSQPAAVLENDSLQDHLLSSLQEARKIVDEATSSDTCKGYIFAKKQANADDGATEVREGEDNKSTRLLYEDFHPFLPRQFEEDLAYTVITIDNYNKLVDEFFSSIEGQKLKSQLTEKEVAAKRKLEATKADQAKRIEGLKTTQQLNIRRAQAIEANVERVQEAMDAVNDLINQGMDWEDIGKLVDMERRRNNPVAGIIMLPLKLHENTITLLLGEMEEEEEDEEGDGYATSSSVSDSGYAGTEASKQKAPDRRLEIDINLGLSPWSNAREYYDEKKMAAVKEEKTVQQSHVALKNAEQKIAAELKKGLKMEKPTLQPIRKQMWFEKFTWFISSDGYLVLGGKDASQNETLYRRYLRKGDIYVHADLHGAPSVIIKNNPSTPDAPIPPSTLSQAGSLAVCASSAWDSKAVMAAWWVNADQVSKSAPTGEYLPSGSFMVRGKKNFLPPAQLLLGFAIVFKISDESKATHIKHRLHGNEGIPPSSAATPIRASEPDAGTTKTNVTDESDFDEGVGDLDDDEEFRANPLQPTGRDKGEDDGDQAEETPPTEAVQNLAISEEPLFTDTPGPKAEPEPQSTQDEEDKEESEADEADTATPSEAPASELSSSKPTSKPATLQPQKKGQQQPKRGQRGKAKKIAAKYKDQDEEDRAAIEALIGASAGRQKAEAEARARAEREAQQAAVLERRRAQHERQQRETAQHEEARRRLMLEEGAEALDPEEAAALAETPLDALVGTPRPGDEILEAVALCAPYAALGRCKYRVKLQPGAQKKGKAVKEILERWKADAVAGAKKGWVDEEARDVEKMWPREIELIKALKTEDLINCVPVGKLRVVMSGSGGGGGGGGGSGGGSGGGGKGKKGGAGGRGKKR